LPFRYEDRSRRLKVTQLEPGQEATVEVVVQSVHIRKTRRRNFTLVEMMAKDETGSVKAVWFNQDYLKDTLTQGRRVLLFGKFERSGFSLFPEVTNPQFELVESGGEDVPTHAGRIVPVYERIGAMSPKVLRRVLHFLVSGMPRNVPELLPEDIRKRHELPTHAEALEKVHFPEEGSELDLYARFRAPAQKRLIFEELFLFFLAQGLRRARNQELPKRRSFPVDDRIREVVRKILPFRLTGAQREVLKTIAEDLESTVPMRRLVQGDVGSGKTIVGVLAAVIVIENGAQVAFMVPTELLAEQHFQNIHRLLEPAGIEVALLSSRLKKVDREARVTAIAAGDVDMVVGTHALIQEDVTFKELGLAIIDEQHRFGVIQRAELRQKGYGCDLLFMTATPIPRSLAMSLYGDLDNSVLDELPPGRPAIRTERVSSGHIERVFRTIEAEVSGGHQVYYVCPLVEESEKMDLKAAVERYESLAKGILRHRRVALVHGRMAPPEREEVMAAFRNGSVDVLVATSVVEVGVDVPNATLIVIEHAERFGLSQLHQLRGRVGRGTAASRAILLTYEPTTDEAEKRLAAMLETNDGFAIAERDLDIRGPGEYFGTRQSGTPLFRIADLSRDKKILEDAKREAALFLSSAESRTPSGERLLRQVIDHWGERFDLVEAG
ncbi:MAG TPA: ATP-dependent DNA helicase RecG, partial [Vicinamibacteria bacterium]|nr:ATP-dependent DNA helicase RecG [Vicinamibacteria bacterium]